MYSEDICRCNLSAAAKVKMCRFETSKEQNIEEITLDVDYIAPNVAVMRAVLRNIAPAPMLNNT